MLGSTDMLCFRVESIENGVITFSVFDRLPNTLTLTATDKAGQASSVDVDLGCIGNVYQGATASADGVQGLVPPAASGEKEFFLRGDGTWVDVMSELTVISRAYIDSLFAQ